MSKCMPKDNEFIRRVCDWLNNQHWVREARVYYDADPFNKRDYVADITLYSNNSWCSCDMEYLKAELRDLGATSIIGCKRKAIARDYLDIAFDKKVNKASKHSS